jgi:hypothetical protein
MLTVAQFVLFDCLFGLLNVAKFQEYNRKVHEMVLIDVLGLAWQLALVYLIINTSSLLPLLTVWS